MVPKGGPQLSPRFSSTTRHLFPPAMKSTLSHQTLLWCAGPRRVAAGIPQTMCADRILQSKSRPKCSTKTHDACHASSNNKTKTSAANAKRAKTFSHTVQRRSRQIGFQRTTIKPKSRVHTPEKSRRAQGSRLLCTSPAAGSRRSCSESTLRCVFRFFACFLP